MDKIKELYYNPKYGFRSSIEGINQNAMNTFLKNQEIHQINKVHINPKNFYPIRANFPYERVQGDLMDMGGVYNGYPLNINRGYRYIFCIIDVFTRKAFTRPLKTKNEQELLNAFKDILKEIGTAPSIFESDNEAGIKGRLFTNFCKKQGIVQFFVQPEDYKAKSVVERFNGTLRKMILLYTTYTRKKKWIDVLQDLTYNYNNHIHRTTGFKPNEAENHIEEIRKIFKNKVEQADEDVGYLQEGTRVRLKIKKGGLDKKTTQNWTKTIHTIERREGNNYSVSDRKNYYKKDELQVINKVEQEYKQEERPLGSVEEQEDEQEDEQEAIEENEQRKQKVILKRVGIEPNNIIEGRRERKRNKRYDD